MTINFGYELDLIIAFCAGMVFMLAMVICIFLMWWWGREET